MSFQKLESTTNDLTPYSLLSWGSLVIVSRFSIINLHVTIDVLLNSKIVPPKFMVVDIPLLYNAIKEMLWNPHLIRSMLGRREVQVLLVLQDHQYDIEDYLNLKEQINSTRSSRQKPSLKPKGPMER